MKNRTLLLIVFTLAMFASVFLGNKAYAATPTEPWNVVADVVYGEKCVSYNLKTASIGQDSAQNRGFFCGEKSRRALYSELCKQNLPKDAVYEYILPKFSKLVNSFSNVNVVKRDATVSFNRYGFHYTEGVDGVSVDKEKLFDALLKSRGKKIVVKLPLLFDKAVTVSQLKQNTVQKGSFTTYYASSGANRCHNVALAASALNGITVGVGETFSFNEIVGKRNEENGYKQSKVIVDGQYTDGVGGGVCQVSTTLYNALLLSEIMPSACQHSLVSSYVLAGFDAMVSDGGADLTFTNTGDSPIYIAAKTDSASKSVTFVVYGKPNEYKVVRQNEEIRTPFSTVEIVDKQKYPELVYNDQIKVVSSGSDGVTTKSYLCFYRNDKLAFRKLIRQNTYKKVDRVVAKGYLQRPAEQ